MSYRVAIVDDHPLFREGLARIVDQFEDFSVCLKAKNGQDMIKQLDKAADHPEVVLLDVEMVGMDGYATANWLTKNRPNIRILALSMHNEDEYIIRMLQAGARGYLVKDSDPEQVEEGLREIIEKGIYYTPHVSHTVLRGIGSKASTPKHPPLSNRELDFIQHACTELTYKEIADRMGLSPSTVEGYRRDLFEKLGVKSRVGLALFAVRVGLAELSS